VCTVVVRWSPGQPVQVLALRDELTSRPFDDPARWWPEFPDAVGGRDRVAGGTWCATDVRSGATALVLNRPQGQAAEPGASSRGVLPLLAATYGAGWRARVRTEGMAAFLLVLATPERLVTWDVDGAAVQETHHAPGTVMVTSGGPEDRKAARWLAGFAAGDFPDGWRGLVQSAPPADDPGALVVRHEQDGLVYGTVFGQLIEAAPGRLRCAYSRRPWDGAPWSTVLLEELSPGAGSSRRPPDRSAPGSPR
jgi:hypothetical protein